MGSEASYGQDFAKRFGAKAAPVFVNRTISKSVVAVTYLRQEEPTHELSEQHPVHDAYVVSYVLRDSPTYSLWENDQFVSTRAVLSGQTTFNDFKSDPRMLVDNPMVALHFYYPRAAFDAIADDADAQRIGDLDRPRGFGVEDPVMRGLSAALAPAFFHPGQASRLFVDHVTTAAGIHIARQYGGMRVPPLKRGGLASWQEKRSLEIIDAHLDGEVSLEWLAQECGLSVSQFSRAFRISVGMAPHQWLLHRRVAKAKVMLRASDLPMQAIAHACGFADQSHLSRVFSRIVGQPPAQWRRATISPQLTDDP